MGTPTVVNNVRCSSDSADCCGVRRRVDRTGRFCKRVNQCEIRTTSAPVAFSEGSWSSGSHLLESSDPRFCQLRHPCVLRATCPLCVADRFAVEVRLRLGKQGITENLHRVSRCGGLSCQIGTKCQPGIFARPNNRYTRFMPNPRSRQVQHLPTEPVVA
jgi:hypothetical protein